MVAEGWEEAWEEGWKEKEHAHPLEKEHAHLEEAQQAVSGRAQEGVEGVVPSCYNEKDSPRGRAVDTILVHMNYLKENLS